MKAANALPLLAALTLAGCTAVPGGPLTGDWGGEHVALHLGPTGGTLEYDCASGTIGPVVPDGGGRFMSEGTHSPGHGGPARQGEGSPSFAARYWGSISGERMSISGQVENGTELGPFTLRRGAAANLFRCL